MMGFPLKRHHSLIVIDDSFGPAVLGGNEKKVRYGSRQLKKECHLSCAPKFDNNSPKTHTFERLY